MSAVQDSLRPARYLPPIEPQPSTPANAPSAPPAPSHRRTHSLAGIALAGLNDHIPLEQRNVSVLTIDEEPEPFEGLELSVVSDAAPASVDALLKDVQEMEKLRDRGNAALEEMRKLGSNDPLVTSLENAIKEIGDVIDRAKELKQAVADGDILDVAKATAQLKTDLQEAADALHQFVKAGQDKIVELKACCSGLLSCFGKKA